MASPEADGASADADGTSASEPGDATSTGSTSTPPIVQEVIELDVAALQQRRSEFADGTPLKVTGEISRIAFGEPTKKGPHFAIWLHKHVFGDGFYDVECQFSGPDEMAGLVEDQTVTVEGTTEKSSFGVKLGGCQMVDPGDVPENAPEPFESPIAESSLEFPQEPEGVRLKAYLPYELEIDEQAILEDGSLPADYMKALSESLVVRNVKVSAGISNEGLAQLAALKGMKLLVISPPLGGDAIDVSELDFSLLAEHPRLRTLTLTKVEGVSDDTLAQIGQLRCLADLSFNSARASVTDDGLAALTKLKSLRRLTLPLRGDVEITDEGLAAFTELPHLQEIRMKSRSLNGSGFASLRDCPRLEILRLRESSVTTEGLESLSELPHLRFLELAATDVGDGLGPVVAQMSKLEHLSLAETKITDAFFESWGPPPQLLDLDVSKTKITDGGVDLLSSKPPSHLQSLGLRNYGDTITPASVKFIQRIKSLERLIAPSTFDDAAKQSLRDGGLDVR